ncbi:MAG: nitroreductase family protein [Bacteroidales bacterium]|nr:nitroreductase family protein [Bacteroidales bacterium]
MSFLNLVKTRQSVRKFSSKPVEKEKILLCVEAVRLAPSACNSQPWKIIVVDNPELKDKLAKETYGLIARFNKFVIQAPVIIVFVIEKPKLVTQIGEVLKNKEYPLIDIGIAAEHFCLQAAEIGLGTCMLGWYNEKPIKKLLEIPEKRTIGLLVALGYEPENYKKRQKIRKNTEQILSFNKYL